MQVFKVAVIRYNSFVLHGGKGKGDVGGMFWAYFYPWFPESIAWWGEWQTFLLKLLPFMGKQTA